MEPSHIALIILGSISFAEALWGISTPARLQEAVRSAVEEVPDRNPGMGVFFCLLAAVLWLVMSPDGQPSDWILVVLSWIFIGGAIVNFKTGAFRNLSRVLILERSPATLRLMYTGEMIFAVAMIYVALAKM